MLAKLYALSTNQRIYYLTLALAFTLPLSRAALSFFALLLPLIWVLDKDIKQKLLVITQTPALVAIALFLLMQFISIIYTSDQALGWNTLRMYSYWIVIFVLATSINAKQVPSIITAFLYGMLISEICAYIIFFEIYPINGHSSDYPNPFMHHILYSIFLALSAALLLNRLFSKEYTLKEKLFIAIFFATITINLFISTGRTGQLAFLVAIFVITVSHLKFSLKALLISVLLSTTLFYGTAKLLPQVEARIMQGKNDIEKLLQGNFHSSWGLRVAFWLISYEVLKEHPLLGVGVGDYKEVAKKILEENPYNFSHAVINYCTSIHYHNQYLMVAVQSGLLGVFAMLFFLYKLFFLKLKSDELQKTNIIFLTVMLTSFIAEPLWIRQFSLMLFIVFTGLMLATHISKSQFK